MEMAISQIQYSEAHFPRVKSLVTVHKGIHVAGPSLTPVLYAVVRTSVVDSFSWRTLERQDIGGSKQTSNFVPSQMSISTWETHANHEALNLSCTVHQVFSVDMR